MMKAAPNLAAAKNSYNLRIFLLLFMITIFIGLVTIRLFNLQILDREYYKELAASQHGFSDVITPKRGNVYLASHVNNSPLLVATTITKDAVYAVPKQITDKKGTAQRLANLLQLPLAEVSQKISGEGSYTLMKKQVSKEVSDKIKELELPGIHLEGQDTRFYPENNLASQVIGFLGFQGDKRVGQYGVEGKFEANLAGKPGLLGAEDDRAGRWLTFASGGLTPARDGDDIYLTIDPAIQFKAQEVLKNTVQRHAAASASVVVMDPKNGKVLAMANYPDFDPNTYGKAGDISYYNNTILTGDYEPGSIFKPITMAAALNEGKLTPQTTYEDFGSVQVDDKVIKNSDGEAHGIQNMIQVLNQSLNTGAYFAQQQVGNETFRKYVQAFGFGKPTDIKLPQTIGDLENLNRKGNIFFATASFGQGITVTPLQMLQSYTAIANAGKLVAPFVVNKIVHPDGSEEQIGATMEKQILDTKSASAVSAMLVDVVENGHGKRAAVPGYYIAGKTGTAQVAYTDRSGYDPNTNIGSFIGFGPVDNPKFLMLVRVDGPKDVSFAESTAAPAFGEIAQFILNYLQVPSTR